MPADMTDPKNLLISAAIYLFFMVVLWKFQLGDSAYNLTKIRIIASVLMIPATLGIVYLKGDD
jgi:hypothetical protein